MTEQEKTQVITLHKQKMGLNHMASQLKVPVEQIREFLLREGRIKDRRKQGMIIRSKNEEHV